MKSSGEHRRGRSMGSAPPPAVVRSGEKDEDLALFHEMKRRETHNFLYPAPDDLDATLSSKFGGMGAPTKKPGTDLLTSESDKNDYDWLLTPPGTPLFPSLDQEAAALAVLSPALSNGSYSSASSASKSIKSSTYSPAESVKGSRGNPSPRRQLSTGSSTPNAISRSRSSPSTAPILTRPSTPTSTGGTRPSTPTSKSSTRSSTPNLKLTISHSSKSYSNVTTPTGTRPSTPTPRSSTPPVRPTTPGGRSSTPTSKPSTPTIRRSLSGGRTGITSPSPTTTRGGPSPKRSTSSSRGNSPSAKRITSVITSIAGMSSEAPPNLRTTMPERSSSMPERSSSTGKSNYSNGSRIGTESGHHNYNNMDESTQNRRRPRSPSVARSFSSSSSQEQRTSSQTSRGSVVSSYDDGFEVNRPSSIGSSRNSAGKWHATGHEELLNGKPSAYANRAAKSPVTRRESSGYGGTPTKKSSDMVKRSADAYQNSPTSAYKHLHSSGPASPFYSSRTNSLLLRAGVGMNTSLNTTSSNASSEHGTTVAADTEGSERDEDDLCSWDSYGRRASMSPRLQQADILVLDKDDEKTVPWQDSLFERANSHGPSSSHSQGSQSTLDAEVTGFYETDGIASLEMLEQLGVMGESYQLKKSSSFRGRSSERQTTSTEDVKVPNLRTDDYGHSRISPHKVLHDPQRSPARHLAHLEKQESLESPRRSRDSGSKIPTHSVFQENHGSPLRLLANLVRPEEVSERPRKSRDFESKSSPRRLSLESQGSSPARHMAQLEKQESLERPRRSRDFESKSSPRRLSLESQGSPARHLGQVEKQEILERPSPMRSRDFDFEAELLRRNGEKSLALQEPQAHNSDIRAACLFVRDFKVGVSPTRNLDSQGNSPRVKKLAIEEMEMKLRNDLSYDWDSVEKVEQPMMGSNGDIERRFSDSATLVSHSKKNVGTPESTGRHSLDFLVTPTDTVHPTKIENSLVTPEISKEEDIIDTRKQELTLPKDVDLAHHISMNSTPTNVVIEDSFVNDVIMDESETESTQPKEVDMDYPAAPEGSQPSGMVHSMFDLQKATSQDSLLSTSQVPGIQSDLSDDGVYAMDEDTPEMLTEDGATGSPSEEDSAILEERIEGEHVLVAKIQQNSPMDVHEVSVTAPEKHKEEDEMQLPAEIQQEAAHEEELDTEQSLKDHAGIADIYKTQHSGADHGQGVVKEELGLWYLEADHQKDVVERFLQAVPFSVGSNASEVVEEGQLLYGEDERETIIEEADGVHASARPVQQVIHSNGNCLHPNTESVVLEKESVCDHDMETVLGNGMDNEGPQELPEHEHISAAVDVKESSPWNLHAYPGAIEEHEESALHGSYDSISFDHAQEDVLTSGAELEGTQDPVAEVVDIKATQGVVKEASVCSSDHQMQESSSLEYFDADYTGDEVSSNLSNHLLQEELQSPEYSNSDSQKDLQHLSDPKEEKGFLETDIPSLQSSQTHYLLDAKYEKDLLEEDDPFLQSSQESAKEDIDLFHIKLSEFDSLSVKNQQLPNGCGDENHISSNCKPKTAQFVDKHPEVLDLSPSSADLSEVQPPKTEFRSASTLCAALEEQIAGLIQKIDSAIEESSKPFSASPQESLLVKDKRSILEPEQDDFTGSMRSSQEEDLLDMLWAEDDETSCSEGSRDQDILISKDCSQREMNGVRSSRLSDRVLPVSLLGHSNEAYEAVVRSSRSDMGVEKRMLEGSSKRIGVSPVDQQDDVVLVHNREPMKSPVKSPMKSPLLWSKELKTESFGLHDSVPEDDHFHLEAQSKIEKTGGEGGQLKPDKELRIESFGQEYSSDSLTESSSYDDVDMKTDAELLSLCKVAEPVCNSETQAKSSAILVSPTPEAGPFACEGSIRKETVEGDATSAKESTQEPEESLRAAERALPEDDVALGNISQEMDMSDILSIGSSVTPEARDQAIDELVQNRDTDESSIPLTLAHSEVGSKVVNEVSNDGRSSLLKETSSKAVPSVGHDTEEAGVEFKEVPQSWKEPEVLPEIGVDSSCSSLTSELVDSNLEEEEIQGKGNVPLDHFLRDADVECVQESEGVQDIHPLALSPHHEVSLGQFSFGLDAVEEPESLYGRDIGDKAKVMPDSNEPSDSIVELTQIPESNSTTNGKQHTETNVDAEVQREDLFTSQSSPRGRRQWNLGSRNLVLKEFKTSPRDGAADSRSPDEISSEGAAVVQEIRMAQGSPESSPGALSDRSAGEVQIQMSENQRNTDSSKRQHISSISGNKIRSERESFRMEENDSGAEPGGEQSSRSSGVADNTIVRENISTEAHVDDEVLPPESQILKGEEIAEGPTSEGHQEVTRLSVLSELPAMNVKSWKSPAACKQDMNAIDEDLGVSADGNGGLETKEVKDSRVGIQSVKRLPSNKAKSVRTISLSPRSRSQTESPSDVPSTPEEGSTPQKPSSYTNITVISPESLQWDRSSPAAETPTKTRSSPGSLSKNMTAAEATDTILFCSSLMNTIVSKAAASAIEKEEHAALASTPTSNGEAPRNPGLSDNRVENYSEGGEAVNCKSQGVSTGPPSVRRALSYMGHQTVPVTPADTSLQIPVDQVIDVKALEAAASTATEVNQKDGVIMPVKVSKSRCGCTIM